MNSNFSTESIIHGLKKNKFIQYSNIVMGYAPGLPILVNINGRLCMKVPYLKYRVTGQLDNTLVFPIRYVVTISLPEGAIVGFEDMSFNKAFSKVEFEIPVGRFRHEAVRNMNKTEYANSRSKLFAEYDKIIKHIVLGGTYSDYDEKRFKTLLNIILEPSLVPFYSAIDSEFVGRYVYPTK